MRTFARTPAMRATETVNAAPAPRRLASRRQRGPVAGTAALAPFGCGRVATPPFGAGTVQTKLSLGQPGDEYEREADRIAASVVAEPDPLPRRASACACGGTCPDCRKKRDNEDAAIQTKRIDSAGVGPSTAPPSVGRAVGMPGRPLDPASRDFMERRFGHDFSGVRVHTGPAAEESSAQVHARAYTVGRDIVFARGEFAPATSAGRELLAHELTHVVQQGGARSPGPGSRTAQPIVQRDLAIEPPEPDAVARALTPEEMAEAIEFNNGVLGAIADSAAIVELIRDVIGVSPQPAVVDEDFVNGVVRWQASFGLTQDGKLGPITARPLFREIGAEGVGRGEVLRRPRYVPAGPIDVPRAGARQATFNMFADFRSDPANHILPSCCEVRQDIQWDAAFVTASVAAGNGAVPHAGFPAAHPADRWIEDRDQANGRYGHRSGPHSDPGAFDRYLDPAGQQNQAFGARFRGSDTPSGFATDRGSWSFRLRVIDVCNGNRLLATSRTLVLNWL